MNNVFEQILVWGMIHSYKLSMVIWQSLLDVEFLFYFFKYLSHCLENLRTSVAVC